MRSNRARVLGVAALLAAAGLAAGEAFTLRSEKTGTVYGPFQFRHGERMVVGNGVFTLQTKREARMSIDEALRRTVIAEIDFREARIADVMEFLREASVAFSPEKDEKLKGVNIIVRIPENRLAALPPITFKARQLSLRDALEAITGVANLRYTVERNWVMVEEKR